MVSSEVASAGFPQAFAHIARTSFYRFTKGQNALLSSRSMQWAAKMLDRSRLRCPLAQPRDRAYALKEQKGMDLARDGTRFTAATRAQGGAGPLAIGLVLAAMAFISVNDMLIKELSDRYPLHQMIFVRSAIALGMTMVLVMLEGGLRLLKTTQPGLHLFRALLIVCANMSFFAALAVMPLASATALFFIAPLLITLFSIPVLGEKIGPRRLGAVVVGFLGVLVMLGPGAAQAGAAGWATLLPLVAATCYAGMQVLTRKLGVLSSAAAMSVYIQVAFLVVAGAFFVVAGDGRLLEGTQNASLTFLFRAWVWPAPGDIWVFAVIGILGGGIGYTLSQAYRMGDPATIAPFEYVALPLAIFWGWIIFGEVPSLSVWLGILLIAVSGIYVFWRERAVRRP